MTRNILSLIIFLLAVLPASAAISGTYTDENGDTWRYQYDAEKNSVTVIQFKGSSINVTTPSSIDGHVVTDIGSNCFESNSTLVSVTVSENVTNIDEYAFYGCAALSSITLPDGLRNIGSHAFSGCSSLVNITLPDGLRNIGPGAFYKCTSLAGIVIPDGVEVISKETFVDCESLSSVTLPGTVTTICESAFARCTALLSITLPSSVTTIENRAFSNTKQGEHDYTGTVLDDLFFEGTQDEWLNVTKVGFPFGKNHTEYSDNASIFHWQCTAIFNMCGHGTAPANQTFYSNYERIIRPADPTAQGYRFDGWYKSIKFREGFNFDIYYGEDIVIHAKWTALENTITFNTGGKGTTPDAQTILSGNCVAVPDLQYIEENGTYYGIEGWYTDDMLTKKFDFNKSVDNSYTLYAKWVAVGHYEINATAGGTVELQDGLFHTCSDGRVTPGRCLLTVKPNSGYSFTGTYKLANRSTHIGDVPQDIAGSSETTYVLDLTEKDADINVTFTTTPVLSITATTDGTATAGTWTLKDGFGNDYHNGSTLTVPSGGMATDNDNITLTVTKDETVGCAMTIVNNGKKKQYTDDVTTRSFMPAGSVDIELFFYDKTDGVLTLFNDDSAQPAGDKNADRLAAADGKERMVTLSGRTLYRDGDWNTLCLPFDLDIEGSALDKTGVTLKELDVTGYYDAGNTRYDEAAEGRRQTGLDGTTLNLYFRDATSIKAGKPYLIKWNKNNNYDSNPAKYDIANPVFGKVTVSSEAPASITSSDGAVTFVGSYAPVAFKANDESILYLGAANKLYWPNAAMTLGACRAHFQLNDEGSASELNLNFDDNDEATGITTTNYTNYTNDDGAWYDLSGRKLSQQPTAKGLYIHNGRKVVVK